jgi:hypothetical protein|tara:strand:- start:14450 stop:15028 length:579 start_codon:yes stop_codon:yes gene_type:complete
MDHRNFADAGHAHMYLRDCIIMIDGEPAYVFSVDGQWTIAFRYLHEEEDNRAHELQIDSKKISWEPVSLGFTEFGGNERRIYKVCRAPRRMWKVGVNQRNLRVRQIGRNNFNALQNLFSGGLRKCILGVWPSWKDIIEQQGGGVFHRHWAVGRKSSLYHMNSIGMVGNVLKDGPVLDEKHSYLQQSLDKDIR